MIATIDIVTEKYDQFNKLYFEGKLHRPKIALYKGTGSLGGYFPKRRRMEITKGIDFEEDFLDDVILHEMVHQYIYRFYKDVNLAVSHGKTFRREVKRLNKQYNLKIETYTFSYKYLKNQNAIQTVGRFLLDCIFWSCFRIRGLYD